MAAKRSATSDLNHDNWDRDEEPEECGEFQRASEDSLKRRVIKTAKRRNPISSVRDNGRDEQKSAFTSFSGFGKAPPTSSSAFSFLSNLTNTNAPPKINGIEEKSPNTSLFKQNNLNMSTSSIESNNSKLSWSQMNPQNNNQGEKSTEYYSKLKGLNISVSNWIKKHVDLNPFINLQPIFRDYEKYFSELENEKQESNKKDESAVTFNFKPTGNIPDSTTEKTSSDGKKVDHVNEIKPQNSVKFSFGNVSTGNVTTTASFSFGSSNVTAGTNSSSRMFSFGTTTSNTTNDSTKPFPFSVKPSLPPTSTSLSSSTPFTFNNVAKPAVEEQPTEVDEEDEPPKNEFTPVIEEDHIYSIRCKVFVKKDEEFGDRGVGNLFLKKIQEKVQLVVRADTSLGNLLLNFILSETIPLKRLGKKDVMLVCIPTPETAPPPVPVLLRVKSSEEADQLLQTLDKYKK